MEPIEFERCAAQGEVDIYRIDAIPGDAKPFALDGGLWVIGHSETGHHHVIERTEAATVYEAATAPEGCRILYAIVREPTAFVHLRGHDTHRPIMLRPGAYEFRTLRESSPEGWRRTLD
jgi:hypothetical protein